MVLVLVGRVGGGLWLFGLLHKKELLQWVLVLGNGWKLLFVLLLISGNIFFFRLPTPLTLFKLLFMSFQRRCCVSLYSKSHSEAQVWFRKGLMFWHLAVDISCKECPIREITSRLFLIIAFVSPLSCSKLSVTWTGAIVAFWIFFCRFQSHKAAFFWVLLNCENTSLFVSGTDSFGKFSGTSRFFDFSFNWSRVNLVSHLNSTVLARLSENFGPIWQSTSSSKSIWLTISLVGDWSPVVWSGHHVLQYLLKDSSVLSNLIPAVVASTIELHYLSWLQNNL